MLALTTQEKDFAEKFLRFLSTSPNSPLTQSKMGGAMGNPIDEPTQAKINETMQDVIKIFSVEFSKSYTQAVIQAAKDEIEPEADILDDLKLQEAPVPSHVLKTGMLVKVRPEASLSVTPLSSL